MSHNPKKVDHFLMNASHSSDIQDCADVEEARCGGEDVKDAKSEQEIENIAFKLSWICIRAHGHRLMPKTKQRSHKSQLTIRWKILMMSHMHSIRK